MRAGEEDDRVDGVDAGEELAEVEEAPAAAKRDDAIARSAVCAREVHLAKALPVPVRQRRHRLVLLWVALVVEAATRGCVTGRGSPIACNVSPYTLGGAIVSHRHCWVFLGHSRWPCGLRPDLESPAPQPVRGFVVLVAEPFTVSLDGRGAVVEEDVAFLCVPRLELVVEIGLERLDGCRPQPGGDVFDDARHKSQCERECLRVREGVEGAR